mmetsp:Transcript_5680/g.11822  ORF Transcript_5680/g.11822 Transcript_5680/m.11822 type:complete len:444 (-) Transcript_5680:202-1533(-)
MPNNEEEQGNLDVYYSDGDESQESGERAKKMKKRASSKKKKSEKKSKKAPEKVEDEEEPTSTKDEDVPVVLQVEEVVEEKDEENEGWFVHTVKRYIPCPYGLWTVLPIVLCIVTVAMLWVAFNSCEIVNFAEGFNYGAWQVETTGDSCTAWKDLDGVKLDWSVKIGRAATLPSALVSTFILIGTLTSPFRKMEPTLTMALFYASLGCSLVAGCVLAMLFSEDCFPSYSSGYSDDYYTTSSPDYACDSGSGAKIAVAATVLLIVQAIAIIYVFGLRTSEMGEDGNAESAGGSGRSHHGLAKEVKCGCCSKCMVGYTIFSVIGFIAILITVSRISDTTSFDYGANSPALSPIGGFDDDDYYSSPTNTQTGKCTRSSTTGEYLCPRSGRLYSDQCIFWAPEGSYYCYDSSVVKKSGSCVWNALYEQFSCTSGICRFDDDYQRYMCF